MRLSLSINRSLETAGFPYWEFLIYFKNTSKIRVKRMIDGKKMDKSPRSTFPDRGGSPVCLFFYEKIGNLFSSPLERICISKMSGKGGQGGLILLKNLKKQL
jgi:hypothetical protein